MLTYPVELAPDDNGTVLVRFPDVPGAVTFGSDEEDALLRGLDALETMLAAMMDDGEDIPLPSPLGNRPGVTLPAMSAAKVMLYRAMRETGVRKAELARRLGWRAPEVDRLLDLHHPSRLDRIETALATLGKRLVITVQAA